jgi:hypothetical protein
MTDKADWLDKRLKTAKEHPELGIIEHVLDWIENEKPPKLEKMIWEEALSSAEKWSKAQQKKGEHIKEIAEDTELVMDFKDGFRFMKLIGKRAYEREGYLMGHCVASYYGKDDEIYSLRDKNNMPHATISKSSQQIKGRGNGSIHPKYIRYVVEFLEFLKVPVRDSEMANLGYVNIEKLTEDIDNKNELFKGKYWHRESTKLVGKDGKGYQSLDLLDYVPLIEENDRNLLKINFELNSFIKASFDFMWGKIKKISLKDSKKSGHSSKNASSGDYSKNASSGDSSQNASSGHYSQNASSGDYSKNEMFGLNSVSVDAGHKGMVKGKIDCWFALTEWKECGDHWEPLCVKAFRIDGKKIKEDIWYTLKDGELTEVKDKN